MAEIFKEITKDAVLVLEGINDCHVVQALHLFHKLPSSYDIYNGGSDDNAIKKLNALIDASDGVNKLETIGIVIDADDNLSAKWQKLTHALTKRGYSIPRQPTLTGTIIPLQNKPTIGIWLMPNNQDTGMLENFCLTILNNNLAVDFINECLDTAKTRNFANFRDAHRSKAMIHTYLAWQDKPALPLKYNIKPDKFNPNHPLAITFKDWLLALFASNYILS